MTDRETNIRSVLFLVIGILLLLSLVICIYIVIGEKDLVKTDAVVTDVKKDVNGTGKNDIYLTYEVDGTSYKYNYYTKDDLNVDDIVSIYYHSKNATSVTTFKVPKIIFICPVIGLVLCILGLYELFKKNTSDDGEEDFKTSVIGVVGNTQQLKIVADTEAQEYEKTPEEKIEPVVKTIKKVVTVQTNSSVDTATPTKKEEVVESVEKPKISSPIIIEKKTEPVVKPAPKATPAMVEAEPTKKEEQVIKPEPVVTKTEDVKSTSAPVPEDVVIPKPAVSSSVTDDIVKKVQNTMVSADSKKVTIDEDDIKQAIKDVLKEVIAEVKEEKTPPKKVEQRRVLPNYYYISGTSLIYEEAGKEAKEISLKTVKKVVRTVNSEGNVVKLIVSNDEIKCILTNMKNIDLEQVASLLNNKMRTIDESFKEEVEYKEY
ncbi:MAG: hypothetical protein ACI4XM_05760 [Candidatus Coprovivens sp.]